MIKSLLNILEEARRFTEDEEKRLRERPLKDIKFYLDALQKGKVNSIYGLNSPMFYAA